MAAKRVKHADDLGKGCADLLEELQRELREVHQVSRRQEELLRRIGAHLHVEGVARNDGLEDIEDEEANGAAISPTPRGAEVQTRDQEATPQERWVGSGARGNTAVSCGAMSSAKGEENIGNWGSSSAVSPARGDTIGSLGSSDRLCAEGDPNDMTVMQSSMVAPSDFAEHLDAVVHGTRLSYSVSSQVASVIIGADARFDSGGSAWHPLSSSRLVYDLLSLLLIVCDSFAMPFAVSWKVGDSGPWAVWTWVVRLFWSCDIILSFFTGYRATTTRLELHIRQAAKRYLKTSFASDLFIVTCDWASVLVSDEMQLMRMGRIVSYARLSRGLRLFLHRRRINRLVYMLKSFNLKKEARLLLDIGMAMLGISWLTHLFCCIWYSIGMDPHQSDTGITWLTLGTDENLQPGTLYAYVTSLHWALTQMTPGSMEVVPKSSGERVYAITVLFLGLVLSTSLISTITAMMTQYRMGLEVAHKNFRMLDSYLQQTRASAALTRTIKAQVAARLSDAQRLKSHDVSHLGLVSSSLREALWCQVCMGHLETHPFWSAWSRMDLHCLESFCNAAMSPDSVTQGDIIFHEKHPDHQMYIVATGELAYTPGPSAVECLLRLESKDLKLHKGMWCSELALWVKWRHAGTMHAACTSEVMHINMSNWRVDGEDIGIGISVLAGYARAFIKYMDLHFEGRSDLPQMVSCEKVISEIPHDLRLKLSEPIMDYFYNSGPTDNENAWLTNPLTELRLKCPKNLSKLRLEVTSGLCDIGVIAGELVRFAFVVALKVYRHTSEMEAALRAHVLRLSSGEAAVAGHFLVCLASLDAEGNPVKVGASLPGTKCQDKETNQESLDRVIKSDLRFVAPSIRRSANFRKEVESFFRESPTYGIRTKYCRTTYMSLLDDSLERYTVKVPPAPLGEQLEEEQRRRFMFRRRRTTEEFLKHWARATDVLNTIKEVIVLSNEKGGGDIYVWLQQADFDTISEKGVSPLLERWVTAIRPASFWEAVIEV